MADTKETQVSCIAHGHNFVIVNGKDKIFCTKCAEVKTI